MLILIPSIEVPSPPLSPHDHPTPALPLQSRGGLRFARHRPVGIWEVGGGAVRVRPVQCRSQCRRFLRDTRMALVPLAGMRTLVKTMAGKGPCVFPWLWYLSKARELLVAILLIIYNSAFIVCRTFFPIKLIKLRTTGTANHSNSHAPASDVWGVPKAAWAPGV